MISPYVRRRRLAAELIRLREEHGYSTQRLATAVGIPRQRISQLQNGHVRPNDDEIMRILNVLKVGERRWGQITTIAREARERGWWEKFRDEMGPRQALYADLEAGARSIAEYQLTLLPGLLQIPAKWAKPVLLTRSSSLKAPIYAATLSRPAHPWGVQALCATSTTELGGGVARRRSTGDAA